MITRIVALAVMGMVFSSLVAISVVSAQSPTPSPTASPTTAASPVPDAPPATGLGG